MKRTSFRKPDMTADAAIRSLKQHLAMCSDERLASLTVDGLLGLYRAPAREIECTLLAAQDTRRRFVAKQEIGA